MDEHELTDEDISALAALVDDLARFRAQDGKSDDGGGSSVPPDCSYNS